MKSHRQYCEFSLWIYSASFNYRNKINNQEVKTWYRRQELNSTICRKCSIDVHHRIWLWDLIYWAQWSRSYRPSLPLWFTYSCVSTFHSSTGPSVIQQSHGAMLPFSNSQPNKNNRHSLILGRGHCLLHRTVSNSAKIQPFAVRAIETGWKNTILVHFIPSRSLVPEFSCCTVRQRETWRNEVETWRRGLWSTAVNSFTQLTLHRAAADTTFK